MRPYYFDFDQYRSRGPYRRHDEYSMCQAVAELLRALAAAARRWPRRVRERRALAALDARMLRDIGVTPSEAAQECNKPFWRA
jgi:uncharacterized protein YjiS (DUF1127 family)